MSYYFKAVRPDGASFYDPNFRWLPADGIIPAGGRLVKHPSPAAAIGRGSGALANSYLSLSTVATDCTGFDWPCRLLVVKPIGRTYRDDRYPHKRRIRAGLVVGELAATDALGPQGVQVAALIERCRSLTADEMVRVAARVAARVATGDAARVAARDAAETAARVAARDAARALLVRDVLAPEHYDTLTRPWRLVVGPCHPDDGPIS